MIKALKNPPDRRGGYLRNLNITETIPPIAGMYGEVEMATGTNLFSC